MSTHFPLSPQEELAGEVKIDLSKVRAPQYGRYLEDFEPGMVFQHPRGFTVDRAMAKFFATTFLQANPLYLNDDYAKAHGFEKAPLCPQHVFNFVLSMGVQNDSEKCIANLGYYNAQFLRTVYPGDTLRAMTHVLERQEKGPDKPGIVTIQTLGVNQHDEVVLQYKRKILVAYRGDRPKASPPPTETPDFPWQDEAKADLPLNNVPFPGNLTGVENYAENFEVGDIIVHANGRTITDEHLMWTYMVLNTHPLHYDRIYSSGLSGPMSGEPIVYGGLVFAWLDGLASRDISENALWEMGFTEGYHTQPAFSGDTVGCLSRVLAKEPAPNGLHADVVTFQFIGVKNVKASEALETHGEDLFIKENAKKKLGKDKLKNKIFEIERQVMIKRRPA